MKNSWNFLTILIVFLFSVSSCCENEIKSKIDPLNNLFLISGHSWNTPLNYLNRDDSSLFIVRDNFIYGDFAILELTNYCENGTREFRFHEFDLMTANNQYSSRNLPMFENRKSKLRNIQTYIFDYPNEGFHDFKNLSVYNDKKYEKYIQSSKSQLCYFVINGNNDTLLWVNPNDGLNKQEKDFLSWMKPIANKVSAQEKIYFDFVTGNRNKFDSILSRQEISKLLGEDFIIPSNELRWNVK